MFYKQCDENKNQYVYATMQLDENYREMDDSLFERAFDGSLYLKSFLENPDEDYLRRKKEFDNEQTVYKMKKYLFDTDYVISKIAEAQINDDKNLLIELKEKYTDIVSKRIEARKTINDLE